MNRRSFLKGAAAGAAAVPFHALVARAQGAPAAGGVRRGHTAGYGPYLDDRRLDIILDNCRRFAAGKPLRNVVDKAAWF